MLSGISDHGSLTIDSLQWCGGRSGLNIILNKCENLVYESPCLLSDFAQGYIRNVPYF